MAFKPGIPKAAVPKPAKFSPGILRIGAMPRTAALHVNRAIPRGHVVNGRVRGLR